MNLLIATPLYPPEAGGPASYAKTLETALPELGVTVSIMKFRDVRHLPKLVRHIAYFFHVLRAARTADVILALDPVSVGLPTMLAARIAHKKLVVKIVGDYAWEQGVQRFGITEPLDEFVTKTDVPLRVRILRAIQRRVAQRADRIIVPSEYLKRIILAWGISAEKIEVVYNCPPLPHDVAMFARPLEGPYIVTIARLVPWKGVASIIEAMPEIRQNFPELRLVVIGDGPERRRLEKLARGVGGDTVVRLLGNRTHEETLAYLAHADALILNTAYEGLSHVILEAFALSVPVLTTAIGGNTELITDEESGLFFPHDSVAGIVAAVHRIESGVGLRNYFITGARRKLADFSEERMLERTVAALSL